MKKTIIIFSIFIIVLMFNIFSFIFVNNQTNDLITKVKQMQISLNDKKNINSIFDQSITLQKNWQSTENILRLFLKRDTLNYINKELLKLNFYSSNFDKNKIEKSLNLIEFYCNETIKDYNPSLSNIL